MAISSGISWTVKNMFSFETLSPKAWEQDWWRRQLQADSEVSFTAGQPVGADVDGASVCRFGTEIANLKAEITCGAPAPWHLQGACQPHSSVPSQKFDT